MTVIGPSLVLLLLVLLGLGVLVFLIRKPLAAFALLCVAALGLGFIFLPVARPTTTIPGLPTVIRTSSDGVEVATVRVGPDSALDPANRDSRTLTLLKRYVLRPGTPVWLDDGWSVEPNAAPDWDDDSLDLSISLSTWGDESAPLPASGTPEHAGYQDELRTVALERATERLTAYLVELAARAPAELEGLPARLRRVGNDDELRRIARDLCDQSISDLGTGIQRIPHTMQHDGRQSLNVADCYTMSVAIPRDRLRSALLSRTRHEPRRGPRRTWASALMAFGVLGLAYVVLKTSTRRWCARHL